MPPIMLRSARNQSRRRFSQELFCGVAGLATSGLFAEHLSQTPATDEGPFYPDPFPIDTDNDLILINESITPAIGPIVLLHGRVLDSRGDAIPQAYVEIWQVDQRGAYNHPYGQSQKGHDPHFQGYGRCLTDARGNYSFRTIPPVPYTLYGITRAPHIHVAVSRNGQRILTTQILIQGHPKNEGDLILQQVPDAKNRSRLMVDFRSVPDAAFPTLTAKFDLVLGHTPNETAPGLVQGGIGAAQMKDFDLARFIMSMDSNQDGTVTAKELPPFMHPLFAQADTDKDGKITLAEAEAVFAQLRKASKR